MTSKEIKEKLNRGEVVLGSWIQEIPFSGLIQMYCNTGLDYVVIDMEHSSIGSESARDMIMLGRRIGLSAIIRVPDCMYHLIAKPLDWGANGIVIPRVETVEQTREIVRATKYPPIGERGLSTVTGHRDYYSVEPLDKYQIRANEENITIIQIETPKGIKNMEDIIKVFKPDCVLLGPMDLSSSLGVAGKMEEPDVKDAIETVIKVGKKMKVPIGTTVNTMEALHKWHEKGLQLFLWSNELRMITEQITNAVKEFRKMV